MVKCKQQDAGSNWAVFNGDCCEMIRDIPSDSVGYSVFSPPFASLYAYSDSPRDFGNCLSYRDFFDQFSHLVSELYRVLMPGRLVSMHCMNLPTTKQHHGEIGIQDFRGDLIRSTMRRQRLMPRLAGCRLALERHRKPVMWTVASVSTR